MKIGMIAPIWYPIPPVGYGGIELVASLLTEGLHERGHDVTLFASGDSKTGARHISSCDIAPCEQIGQVYPDLIHALTAYTRADEFDIIHDHSGMIGPAIGAFCGTPVLHTMHGPATQAAKRLYKMLDFSVFYNAISNSQRAQFGDLNFVDTIYNAIDLDKFEYSEEKEDYLLFLGRMNPEKGAHLAVEAANRLGRRLKLVAKMVEPPEKEYFETKVKPLLTRDVEVMGEIKMAQKAELFTKASCTIFPIQWEEPFGLVMIESQAAGTPVIAFNRGAAPEVIADGFTGYVVETMDEMLKAIDKVGRIRSIDCREFVQEKFSKNKMVDGYVNAYQQIIEKKQGRAA